MNCRECALFVTELARDQLPTTTARAQALQHTERCAACAARLSQEIELVASMRLVMEDLAQQEAPAHLEANLLAALHAQAERQVAVSPLAAVARWWSWRYAAITVVSLFLLALLAGVTWQNFHRKGQKPEVQRVLARPDRPAPPAPMGSNDVVATAPAPRQIRARPHRALPRRSVPEPSAPSRGEAPLFYSLVAEGEMAPLESGRIVRIEVPAATLVTMGVPLTEATLTQPIQADLLLGQDGLARAIRFVPYSQTIKTQ